MAELPSPDLAAQLREIVNDPRVVLIDAEKAVLHAAADRLDAQDAVIEAARTWVAAAERVKREGTAKAVDTYSDATSALYTAAAALDPKGATDG